MAMRSIYIGQLVRSTADLLYYQKCRQDDWLIGRKKCSYCKGILQKECVFPVFTASNEVAAR